MTEDEKSDDLRGKIERYNQGSYIDELHTAAEALAGMVPVLGSPLQAYINEASTKRRAERLKELFLALKDDLDGIKDRLASEYLRTDDFTELLEETLRRVASERDDEKKRIYKNILVGIIEHQDVRAYNEQLRYLKMLENLERAHIAALRAIMVKPTREQLLRWSGFAGFKMHTLEERLPGIPPHSIQDLVSDLNRVGLTHIENLHSVTSPISARDLSGGLTPFGERFVTFLKS